MTVPNLIRLLFLLNDLDGVVRKENNGDVVVSSSENIAGSDLFGFNTPFLVVGAPAGMILLYLNFVVCLQRLYRLLFFSLVNSLVETSNDSLPQ